jgi:hypothetical protein
MLVSPAYSYAFDQGRTDGGLYHEFLSLALCLLYLMIQISLIVMYSLSKLSG